MFDINELVNPKNRPRPRKTDDLTIGSAVSGRGTDDLNDPQGYGGQSAPPRPTPTPTPKPRKGRPTSAQEPTVLN